jgi:hypothetical protein
VRNNWSMEANSTTHPNDWPPSLEVLLAYVAEVRSRGIGNREKPLTGLDVLRWTARYICPDSNDEESDTEAIEYIIGRAASRLHGKSAKAVEALLGLSNETRGLSVGKRRQRAAEILEKSLGTFHVRYETHLLGAVAAHLQVLIAERRLESREREFNSRERTAERAQNDPSAEQDDSCESGESPNWPWEPLISQKQVQELIEKHQRETHLQLF